MVVWNFELYMLPLALLLLLLWNYLFSSSRETTEMVRSQHNTDLFTLILTVVSFLLSKPRKPLINFTPFFCCSQWKPCLNGRMKKKIRRTR